MTKRINAVKNNLLTIMLCLIVICLCFVDVYPNAVKAETVDYNTTYVMDDLKYATVGGKTFNTKDYPYLKDGLPQLLTLSEYCYSQDEDIRDYFGLYVYVYNPGAIKFSETGNKIQLAVEYSVTNTPSKWGKFELAFCSKSTSSSNAELFYKFRIIDESGSIYTRVNETPNMRYYDVSGIELYTDGARTATEYNVGASYVYSGYAQGCAEGKNKYSTLEYTVSDELKTIRLNVKPTVWRSESSALGKNHRNQLNSVYFSVPDEVLNSLGKLRDIHAEWYEYKTKPIIITDDSWAYNHLISDKYLGKEVPDNYSWDFLYGFVFDRVSYDPLIYNLSFNSGFSPAIPDSFINPLYYLFYAKDGISGYTLPSETLTDWIYSYKDVYGAEDFLPVKTGKNIPSALFGDRVDDGRVFGYNNLTISDTDTYDLLSYSSNHGFWDQAFDYGFWDAILGNTPKDESLNNVSPIYAVKDEDVSGDFGNRLYIAKSDTSAFKEYYDSAKRKNETTFLFRFALTDYMSVLGTSGYCETGFWGNSSFHINQNDDFFSDDALNSAVSYETVFLDFDIIDLGFYNETGKCVVMPVVSSPIDVIGAIEVPKKPGRDWWWVYLIIAALAMLLLMPFLPVFISLATCGIKGCISVLKFVIKAVFMFITMPFKIIKRIIDGDGKT